MMLLHLAAVLALLSPSNPPSPELMKPARAFVTAFNAAQIAFPLDAFTADATVLDQFPPFVWTGKDGARRWWTRLLGPTPAKHARMLALHEHLTLHEPEFINVTAERAYFNIPCTFTYVLKGKTHSQDARWVVTEVRTPAGWRIIAHAWAVNAQS